MAAQATPKPPALGYGEQATWAVMARITPDSFLRIWRAAAVRKCVDDRQHETPLRHLDERCPLGVTESDGVEGSGFDVLLFFLDTGIVPSLLECESKERSLPKDRLCLYYQLWRIPFTTFPFVKLSKGVTTSTRLQNRT